MRAPSDARVDVFKCTDCAGYIMHHHITTGPQLHVFHALSNNGFDPYDKTGSSDSEGQTAVADEHENRPTCNCSTVDLTEKCMVLVLAMYGGGRRMHAVHASALE